MGIVRLEQGRGVVSGLAGPCQVVERGGHVP
jgi:hypothetical protein